MNPSIDDILAQGSDSFRRLNATPAGPVPAIPGKKPRKVGALAAALPHTESQQEFGLALGEAAKPQGGSPASFDRRPRVAITLYRVRLLDRDNKWASVKFLLDAICAAGLVPNDRECDIDLSVTQIRAAKFAHEGTGIIITYPQ